MHELIAALLHILYMFQVYHQLASTNMACTSVSTRTEASVLDTKRNATISRFVTIQPASHFSSVVLYLNDQVLPPGTPKLSYHVSQHQEYPARASSSENLTSRESIILGNKDILMCPLCCKISILLPFGLYSFILSGLM